MALANGLKIARCLVPLVLFAAMLMPASFAEEAAHGRNGPQRPAASGARTPSSEPHKAIAIETGSSSHEHTIGHTAESGKANTAAGRDMRAADVNSSLRGGKDQSGIDTRIAVQPPTRRGGTHDGAGQLKIEPGRLNAGNARAGALGARPTLGASTSIRRSAIGAPLPQHEEVMPRDGAHHSLPPVAQGPAPTVAAMAKSTSAGPARIELEHSLGIPNVKPIIDGGGIGRRSISGTAIKPIGVGPPRLGGPALTAGGISGTTIRRPKF